MSLLKTAPPMAVHSLDEIFAIAHAMEHEAATRYAELAQRARDEGAAELGALFERLADEERSHEASVVRWSQQRRAKAPDPAHIKWEIPQTFDQEAAQDLAASRLASMYRVLSMAVRNEERAFAFWSYVAAEAETSDIREAAERMAHEELAHVALLRRARRAAYHAEDRPQSRPLSQSDRLIAAAARERYLAGQLDALADQSEAGAQVQARAWAARSRAMAEGVSNTWGRGGEVVQDLDPVAAAERLVEDYLDIGDLSRDEALTLQVQSLARSAIARLAWLRGAYTR
jgi:rubrerythrin